MFPIVFMAVLTAVFTFILSFLNYSTADQIEFNEQTDRRIKILYVFDIDMPSEDPDEIEKIFNEEIEELKEDGKTVMIEGNEVYVQKENDEVTAYAFPVRGAGLWGSILAYVGVTDDYSEIVGLDFISQNETPGLGGRIDELEFKEQFRGIELSGEDSRDYIIYNPAPGGNVDAISGATLTSKSVSNILNKDIKEFIKSRGGE